MSNIIKKDWNGKTSTFREAAVQQGVIVQPPLGDEQNLDAMGCHHAPTNGGNVVQGLELEACHQVLSKLECQQERHPTSNIE